jgi:hypothetical protein
MDWWDKLDWALLEESLPEFTELWDVFWLAIYNLL